MNTPLNRTAESLILALIGAALIAAGAFDVYAVLPWQSTDSLSISLPVVSYQYGILMCLIALASYILGLSGTSIRREFTSHCRSEAIRLMACVRSISIAPWAVLPACGIAVATLVGVALRLWFLDQPMRYDEAFAFNNFVKGDKYSIFYYPLPNNHVLYSLCEYASQAMLGGSPGVLRLPALLCGIALVPLLYAVSRRLNGGRSPGFAAYCAAVSPMLVLYSTNGRGYSMLALFTMLLIYLAVDAQGRVAQQRTILLSLLAAAGMLIMPSMLYALGGILAWLMVLHYLETRSLKHVLMDLVVPLAVFTAMLTLLFYLPVALASGGLQVIGENRFVEALPDDRFLPAVLPHALDVVASFTRYVGAPLAVITALLAMLGAIAGARGGRRPQALLLPCMIAGSFLVFALKRSIPFDRTWIYMIPIVLVLADTGLASLNERWLRLSPGIVFGCLATASAAYAVYLGASHSIANLPDTGAAPEARAVATYLAPRISRPATVCAESPLDAPIDYYLRRQAHAFKAAWQTGSGPDFAVGSGPSSHFFAQHEEEFPQSTAFGDETVHESRNTPLLERTDGWICWHPALHAPN